MQNAELILNHESLLGEGPSWDEAAQRLYWVNIMEKKLHIYDPVKQANDTFQLDQYVGAAVKRSTGGLVLALQHGFHTFDLNTEQLTPIEDPESHLPNNRFNDGKCDPAGRFWAGTMAIEGGGNVGALYCLDTDLSVRKAFGGVGCSNGLAWSPDHKTMYYIDTPTRQVAAFDYNIESGEIQNKRIAITIPEGEGGPDGMTIDAEGNLWIAHWGGYKVSKWDPVSGKHLADIPIPAKQVTSCVFGGENLDELYITTARIGLEEQELQKHPHSGGLFRVKTEVKGMATYEFLG